MKIQNLLIERFRHFGESITIELGDRLTVISGQNGTGKSSVLGWIAQLCKFDNELKQLNGNKFEADWGKIFRFCE